MSEISIGAITVPKGGKSCRILVQMMFAGFRSDGVWVLLCLDHLSGGPGGKAEDVPVVHGEPAVGA